VFDNPTFALCENHPISDRRNDIALAGYWFDDDGSTLLIGVGPAVGCSACARYLGEAAALEPIAKSNCLPCSPSGWMRTSLTAGVRTNSGIDPSL
jgi:hypothetical protein